jgi:hypothetical protein
MIPRRFLLAVARLWLSGAVLVAGTHLLARRAPPDRVSALLPDPTCTAPCWQGLRPGYIAPDRLEAWIGDPPGDWQPSPLHSDLTRIGLIDSWQIRLPDAAPLILTTWRIHSPAVDRLDVAQADLRLGDVIAALGEPDFLEFNLGPSSQGQVMVEFRLYYPRSSLIVLGSVLAEAPYLAPYTAVEALIYQALPWSRPALAVNWRGFGSLVAHYYPGGVIP